MHSAFFFFFGTAAILLFLFQIISANFLASHHGFAPRKFSHNPMICLNACPSISPFTYLLFFTFQLSSTTLARGSFVALQRRQLSAAASELLKRLGLQANGTNPGVYSHGSWQQGKAAQPATSVNPCDNSPIAAVSQVNKYAGGKVRCRKIGSQHYHSLGWW